VKNFGFNKIFFRNIVNQNSSHIEWKKSTFANFIDTNTCYRNPIEIC
jgi:hypothetical protein